MPTTTYKGLSVQAAASNSGTWGAGASHSLNEGVFEIVDRNLGGIVSKSMAAGDVTLTGTEPENAIVRLTGTLTANRVLTSSCQGFYFVENLTSGSFTVTVTNGVAGVVVPQNTRVTIIADTTNGCRIAAQNNNIVGGTKMLFFQTSAPTGWTKDTSLDNGTIRLVSGSVGADGGSVNFTDAFVSQSVAGTVGNTTLTLSQIPAHRHFVVGDAGVSQSGASDLLDTQQIAKQNTNGSGDQASYCLKRTNTDATLARSSSSGGDEAHTHTFTGTAINLAVKYADAIRATLSN